MALFVEFRLDILQVNRKTLRISEESNEHIPEFENVKKRKNEKGDESGSFDEECDFGEVFYCISRSALFYRSS